MNDILNDILDYIFPLEKYINLYIKYCILGLPLRYKIFFESKIYYENLLKNINTFYKKYNINEEYIIKINTRINAKKIIIKL